MRTITQKCTLIALIITNNLIGHQCALFRNFPHLEHCIPYVSLGDLPTPIIKAKHFMHALKTGASIYIKRDDLTGKLTEHGRLYGGNKVRKLEWLLADALQKGAQTIITYGGVGSNHALATAVYAHQLNFKSLLMLTPQPYSTIVRQNLLLDALSHAQLHFFPNSTIRNAACEKICSSNTSAYFIPTGGSNPIGALGFVNALYELNEQIQEGIIPEPDRIYVPMGSCGTVAGLLLGLALLTTLKTKIVAVCVEPWSEQYQQRTVNLFYETNKLLHAYDATIPLCDVPEDAFIIYKDYGGPSYGVWTQQDILAIKLFNELEHIQLEGTYSSKPVTACIQDIADNIVTNQVVLLWSTYCGLDFSTQIEAVEYTNLSSEFHTYFTHDIQTLNHLTNACLSPYYIQN